MMVHLRRLKWLLVIAITMLAAFLRLYQINVLPPGETFDLAYYGLDAPEILGGETPIFFETNLPGRPALNPFFFAASVLGMAISLWRFERPSGLRTLVPIDLRQENPAGSSRALATF